MKTLAFAIRRAEPRDAETLSAIHVASWRLAYSGILPFRGLAAMIHRRGGRWWENAVRGGAAILVAEFDGRVVGYATMGRNRTPGIEAGGEIYEIYLLPEYQGLGFGRRLFDAARVLLAERGLAGLAVWALAENDNALLFYRALGGAEIAEGFERFDGVPVRKVAFRWR